MEINNTFYRMPKTEMLENWNGQVPEEFRFAIKASRRITHKKRLHDCADEVEYLMDTLKTLGERLGCVLFQLPPWLKKDVPRLRDFCASLPKGTKGAFEFRHETWIDEQVRQCLSDFNQALCIADIGASRKAPAIAATADWGYLRLRREKYTKARLGQWMQCIREQPWRQAFVFFKHEDEATAPKLASQFLSL